MENQIKVRPVFKCPLCGRKPLIGNSPVAPLQTVFCCRFLAGKPDRGAAIVAWNTLISFYYSGRENHDELAALLSHWQQPNDALALTPAI